MTFLLSERAIPVWWTQYPRGQAVLTGWFGGPRTAGLDSLDPQGLVEAGLDSLAAIFKLSREDVARVAEKGVRVRVDVVELLDELDHLLLVLLLRAVRRIANGLPHLAVRFGRRRVGSRAVLVLRRLGVVGILAKADDAAMISHA